MPLNAEEIRDLMQRLAGGIGQRGVALRCDCENLETVYVGVDEGGTVRVTDDHRTFQYLGRGTDSAYVPMECIDLAAAARVCQELGVDLRPAPPDGYPSIECVPNPGEPVSDTVDRVAEAIDRIFALSMRPKLK